MSDVSKYKRPAFIKIKKKIVQGLAQIIQDEDNEHIFHLVVATGDKPSKMKYHKLAKGTEKTIIHHFDKFDECFPQFCASI